MFKRYLNKVNPNTALQLYSQLAEVSAPLVLCAPEAIAFKPTSVCPETASGCFEPHLSFPLKDMGENQHFLCWVSLY